MEDQKKEYFRKTLYQIQSLCYSFSDFASSEMCKYIYYHKIVSIIEFSYYLGILSDEMHDYLLNDTADLSIPDTVDYIRAWVNVTREEYHIF